MNNDMKMATQYEVLCFGEDGNLKWSVDFNNLVTIQGLQEVLKLAFAQTAGSGWYVGLKGSLAGYVESDTLEIHDGWTEFTGYQTGLRPQWIPGTPTAVRPVSIDNDLAKAVYYISSPGTIYGCFLCDSASTNLSTDVLYGVGDFTLEGQPFNRPVVAGDTINVTVRVRVT